MNRVKPLERSTPFTRSILFRKFKVAAAEFGRFNAVLYAVSRLLGTLWGAAGLYRYYLIAQPVPDRALLPGKRGRSISVERMNAGHWGFAGLPLSEQVIASRDAQGAVCFGAFQEDAIQGCLWLCLGPYDEDEVRCRFEHVPENSTAWDFDVYVRPEARGSLVFARLWDEANAFLRERGIAWSMSRVSAFNPGSLASHASLGAKRIASAVYLKLWRWQVMVADVPPYLHLSTGPSSVPRLRVAPPGPNCR